MSLASFLLRMPKAELHVHLEGSIRPSTLLTLARRHGIDLPARDEEGLARWFRFRDFEHFVQIYLTICRCLRDPEDFVELGRDILQEQARQNVLYSEVHFTVATHLGNGANGGEIRDALCETLQAGEKELGVRTRLIADMVRNVGPRQGDLTLEWALAGRGRGVVALGLTGSEALFPSEPFREHFAVAKQEGLHRVAHAGEHAGPESIRTALEVCDPERIGHGVRAVEDPGLVEELRRRGMPLEICPTSNVCLGVFPSIREHAFDPLYRAGVPVSINSDDPPIFGTTLSREYLKLHEAFGYTPEELAAFSLAALRQSFLPPAEKDALEPEFRRQFAALGEELLGAPVVPAA